MLCLGGCVSVETYRAEQTKVRLLEHSRSIYQDQRRSVLTKEATIRAIASAIEERGDKVHAIIKLHASRDAEGYEPTSSTAIVFSLLDEQATLIDQNPRVAMEFPMRFIVTERAGVVLVKFPRVANLLRQYDISQLDAGHVTVALNQILHSSKISPRPDEDRRL